MNIIYKKDFTRFVVTCTIYLIVLELDLDVPLYVPLVCFGCLNFLKIRLKIPMYFRKSLYQIGFRRSLQTHIVELLFSWDVVALTRLDIIIMLWRMRYFKSFSHSNFSHKHFGVSVGCITGALPCLPAVPIVYFVKSHNW